MGGNLCYQRFNSFGDSNNEEEKKQNKHNKSGSSSLKMAEQLEKLKLPRCMSIESSDKNEEDS